MRTEQSSEISGLHTGFIREDRLVSLEAAIAWGVERCHSEAAQALLPALAALLSEFNATVLPVEHEPGTLPEIDFRVTLSRPMREGHARRLRYSIQSEPGVQGCIHDIENGTLYRVPGELCRTKPWDVAGIIVAQLLQDAALQGK